MITPFSALSAVLQNANRVHACNEPYVCACVCVCVMCVCVYSIRLWIHLPVHVRDLFTVSFGGQAVKFVTDYLQTELQKCCHMDFLFSKAFALNSQSKLVANRLNRKWAHISATLFCIYTKHGGLTQDPVQLESEDIGPFYHSGVL